MYIIMLIYVFIIFLVIYYTISKTNLVSVDSVMMTYINYLFELYSPPKSVFNPNDFDWHEKLRSNWRGILKELEIYETTRMIPLHKKINKYVSQSDVRDGWRTLYLRAYNVDTLISKEFPLTMGLLKGDVRFSVVAAELFNDCNPARPAS